MTHVRENWVQETTASTGTGALTPAGATTGNRAFSTVMAASDTTFIEIENADKSEREICATVWNGTVLSRGALLSSTTGSRMDFSAGGLTITMLPPASQMWVADQNNVTKAPGAVARMTRKVTSGTSTAMAATDHELVINKTVSAAHAVTLPPTPLDGQEAIVTDGKGDLDVGVNNITVSGDGGATINGAASVIMQAAWQSIRFRALDGNWQISA